MHLKRGNLAVRHIELVAILKGLHSQKIYKMQHTVSHLSALNPDSQRGRHGRFRRRQLTDLFFFTNVYFDQLCPTNIFDCISVIFIIM